MKKVKVGVIGCGYIGKTHAMAFYHTLKAEVVAVADVVEERAKELAEMYGAKPYRDYKEMIEKEDLEAVSIGLPTRLHAETTIFALEHGKHVICEKPMAPTLEECDRMIESAHKNSLNLMIAQTQRYWQLNRETKWLIDHGFIGKTISVWNRMIMSLPEKWGDDSVMMGQTIHGVDLIRWWVGSEVESVYGKAGKYATKFVDNGTVILNFKNGVYASIETSIPPRNTGPSLTSAIVVGDEGILYVDTYKEIMLQKGEERTLIHSIGPSTFEGPNRVNAFSSQMEEFIDSIVEGREPAIPGEEGRKNVEIVLAWLRSSDLDEPVRLPLK